MTGPSPAERPNSADIAAFDVRGALPTGTVVLEASAGTGKTYTVGALVARYVAEGMTTLPEMLVVTFGRVASQELRERVRGQLVLAERTLADQPASRDSSDELLVHLATGTADEVAGRRRRLATALADFDAATIATTHQFCQQVLTGLGVAGDTDADVTLVEDLDDLVVEVVDDLYVRKFGAHGAEEPSFSYQEALAIARSAVNQPQSRLEPVNELASSSAALRVRFAAAVRAQLDQRKRARRVLGYDDLLSRLADVLAPGVEAARARMRARWRVVIVDEFQDTDPVQWEVLRRAFVGAATVILIGDPKQAIYAFRGGDIVTYLAAASAADSHATLGRNYRTDQPLVSALQVLTGGTALGDERIVVRPVAAIHPGSRLSGLPRSAPLRLRWASRHQFGRDRSKPVPVGDARDLVAKDLAHDIAAVLRSRATFDGRSLVAGDIAVLVNTHAQALLVREALLTQQVPAVVAGSGSVFATQAGEDWLVLLDALEQPHRSAKVRAAALTPFLGLTAIELAKGGDDLTDRQGARLREWSDLVAQRGVAALLEVVTDLGLGERVLSGAEGERLLTDLRHIGQSLHAAAVSEGLGLASLVEWLRRRRTEAPSDTAVERSRRLDSDAAAVQVATVHSSKGLQYPLVYLPFAFDRFVQEPTMLSLHDDAGQRVLDVGGSGTAGRSIRQQRAAAELAGESLRLLYVGLTRAQSQVVLWWVPSTNTPNSALHRLLFGRPPGSAAVPDTARLVSDLEAAQRFEALERGGGPSVEPAVFVSLAPPEEAPVVPPEMAVNVFDRPLDLAWRRTSYSALARAGDQHGPAGMGSEPESEERADEEVPLIPTEAASTLFDVISPMTDLPTGTTLGTLVHAVLEHTDPTAADLGAELATRAAEQVALRPGVVRADELAGALEPALRTPLGPLADQRTLTDISVGDRLTELDFELPLGGGDTIDPEARAVLLGDLVPLLRAHLPEDDPLAGYADRLATPEMARQPLRGYLTGSLDVVLRLPGPRYLVADYKTNWLGDPADLLLTAWHYRPEALARVMQLSHYPLQALLYSVALHRFLRWRQPGYQPEQHLGGVLYLYLRGMCGPATPVVDGNPCGVFSWHPPAALVVAMSDLLDGRGVLQ